MPTVQEIANKLKKSPDLDDFKTVIACAKALYFTSNQPFPSDGIKNEVKKIFKKMIANENPEKLMDFLDLNKFIDR